MRDLCDLLAPMRPQQFLEEYWERASLYIASASGARFSDLFDREHFDAAIARSDQMVPGRIRVARFVKNELTGLTNSEEIAPTDVESAIADGFTICVTNISAADEDLLNFARVIQSQLHFLGDAWFNCYLSPPNSGADLHFDNRVTLSLQIAGHKRWRYGARAAVPWPLSNAQMRNDGTAVYMLPWAGSDKWERLQPVDCTSLQESVLSPGDLLCLPAGTWHDAKAIDTSLALNLALRPLDFFGFLLRFLIPGMLSLEQWRSGVPPALAEERGTTPSHVTTHLLARVSELRAYLERLDPGGAELVSFWRDQVKLD